MALENVAEELVCVFLVCHGSTVLTPQAGCTLVTSQSKGSAAGLGVWWLCCRCSPLSTQLGHSSKIKCVRRVCVLAEPVVGARTCQQLSEEQGFESFLIKETSF